MLFLSCQWAPNAVLEDHQEIQPWRCLEVAQGGGGGALRQRGSGGRQSRSTIPFSSTSRFMSFRESKPEFLSPSSFSTMAELTPTTSVVVELPETSENPTPSGLFTKRKLHASLPCCVACCTCHNTNSRTVIQITKKCPTLALQCVYSHARTNTRTVVAHCLIGGPSSLGGPSRERGGNMSPT